MTLHYAISPKTLLAATTMAATIFATSSLPTLAQDAATPPAAEAPAAPAAEAPAAAEGEGTPVTFTAAQARRGNPLYRDNCAACHGDRLQGALEGPALAGEDFRATWFNQPVANLYNYTAQYMPQDRPGALPAQDYADIVAFILDQNNVEPSGDAELPPDPEALATMMLPEATE